MSLVVTPIEYPRALTGAEPKAVDYDAAVLRDMYRRSPAPTATNDQAVHEELFDNDEGLKCAVAYDKTGNKRTLRGFVQYAIEPEYGFAQINNLYVEQSDRKRGVGRALLERVVSEAESSGVGEVELFATENAVPFYTRLGFIQDMTDESEYPRMILHLKKHS